jgi:hypothetical protein
MLRPLGLVAQRPFALLVFLVPLFPGGGVPAVDPSSLIQSLRGCGRGRYRDANTHKCRGPADVGH